MINLSTIIARSSNATEKTALNKVGLYISSSSPPSPSTLRNLEALGINQLFVENGAVISNSSNTHLTQCIWHDTPLGTDQNIAIISQVSPLGALLSGSRGLPIVSSAATTPGGFNALATNWELYERKARETGHSPDRNNWSLVTPMHLSDTRHKAKAEVAENLKHWLARHPGLNSMTKGYSNPTNAIAESGFAVIGSRRDAKKQIERLTAETGGFGNLLLLVHDWAEPDHTYRSMEICLEVIENFID